jgi:hypothetical protein
MLAVQDRSPCLVWIERDTVDVATETCVDAELSSDEVLFVKGTRDVGTSMDPPLCWCASLTWAVISDCRSIDPCDFDSCVGEKRTAREVSSFYCCLTLLRCIVG